MKSFAIGSLTLLSNGLPTAGILLQTPIEGLESPNYRITTYARPGQSGGVVSSMFYDSRTVILNGQVTGTSALDFENNRIAIETACLIKKDDNGYPSPTRVTLTTLAGTNLYFDAYIDKPVMAYEEAPNTAKFMITMTVPNPYLYSPTAISSGSIYPPTGGGFTLPVTLPLTSSPSVGGTVSINNTGNVRVSPKITLYGMLTNPVITNQTTGRYIALNYTLATGNIAQIDMYEHNITLNSSSSLNGTKTTDSDWWSLATGTNQISVTSSSSSDTGYAIVSGNPAFVGV